MMNLQFEKMTVLVMAFGLWSCKTTTNHTPRSTAQLVEPARKNLCQSDRIPTTLGGCNKVVGNVVVKNQTLSQLKWLDRLKIVMGDLVIVGNPNIKTLKGFSSLETVTGDIVIADNLNLQSLEGLEALKTIGGLRISRNPQLQSLVGLSAITANLVALEDNRSLVSLEGLNLQPPLQDFHLIRNSVGKISGLTQIKELHSLKIVGNSQLDDLAGVASLRLVKEHLHIEANSSLQNLNGLESLEKVFGNIVLFNPSLKSIGGLQSVKTLGGNFAPVGLDQLRRNDSDCPTHPGVSKKIRIFCLDWLNP